MNTLGGGGVKKEDEVGVEVVEVWRTEKRRLRAHSTSQEEKDVKVGFMTYVG